MDALSFGVKGLRPDALQMSFPDLAVAHLILSSAPQSGQAQVNWAALSFSIFRIPCSYHVQCSGELLGALLLAYPLGQVGRRALGRAALSREGSDSIRGLPTRRSLTPPRPCVRCALVGLSYSTLCRHRASWRQRLFRYLRRQANGVIELPDRWAAFFTPPERSHSGSYGCAAIPEGTTHLSCRGLTG